MSAGVELGIVVPVFREAANVAPLCARLIPVLEQITPDWEILFVDDGSTDETLAAISIESRKESRIRAISFSRNFGKEIAIAAGLDNAQGNAVVIMDADLQHPPEMIRTFVEYWRQGYVMVYGQRTDRSGESSVKRGFSHLFYSLFDRFAETTLPEGAGDFRLIARKGVEVLRALPERARFSKGLYAWIGFRSIGVPFVVEQRQFGASKWSFRKLFRFAFDGMTSFTTVPLRIWTYLGGAISLIAIAYAVFTAIHTIIYGPDVPGYPSLIVSIMFFSGVQLMSLGIVGEYVGRIFAEVKRRPLYIIAERIGETQPAQPLHIPAPLERRL